MNLATMRSRLRKRIGNPTSSDVPDSQLNECINDAYREITDKYRFRFARKARVFDTIIGEHSYALPEDAVVVINVRNNTNNQRLTKRSLEWANKYEESNEDIPQHFVLYENYIKLYPTPDAVYNIQVYYRATVVDLSIDADTPVIPTPWHMGILYLARFLYWDTIGDIAKAQWAMQVWNQWVATKPDEIGEEEAWDENKGTTAPTLGREQSRVDFDRSD